MDQYLYAVSEEEKYYFDLRGYLVVRNVLTAEEVGECNAAIDHFADQIAAYPGSLARLEGFHGTVEPVRLLKCGDQLTKALGT